MTVFVVLGVLGLLSFAAGAYRFRQYLVGQTAWFRGNAATRRDDPFDYWLYTLGYGFGALFGAALAAAASLAIFSGLQS